MLFITVHKPFKSETQYLFSMDIRTSGGVQYKSNIGIERTSFSIPHAAVWDTFYPLMFITRNGGPLYGKEFSTAAVHFDYQASRPIVDFFIKRSANFGLDVHVNSQTAEIGIDVQTNGDLLLFGGGKDSRLLLGMLRETGSEPRIVSAKGKKYASDIQGALTFDTTNFSMPNRIVPALMMAPKNIFHGAGLGEVHETTPWHQYMDISTPNALRETSELLRSIGMDTQFHVPLAVVPYNITQKVLADRYDELYRHQYSVDRNSQEWKALHIALCKLYHGLDYSDWGSFGLLEELSRKFVYSMQQEPERIWGYRNHYEIIAREIRALLYRLSRRQKVPIAISGDWDEDWIDQIHTYINPDVEERFMEIFRQYAPDVDRDRVTLPLPLRLHTH